MRLSFTASDRMAEIAIDDKNDRITVIVAHGRTPVITRNSKPITGFPPDSAGQTLRGLFERLEPVLTRYVIEREQMKRFHMLASIRDEINKAVD